MKQDIPLKFLTHHLNRLSIDTGNMDSTLFERLRDAPDMVVLLA